MEEKRNVPKLRFPGFTDPWEQRKLGEVAHRVIRKNEEGMSDLPLTISAQHGLVDQRDFFNSQVASRDMRGYYLLERGEFAYNKSTSSDSPWGAIKRLTEYEKGCLSTLYICFGLDEGDPDFLVTYYETSRWHRGIRMIAAEGARNHGLLNIAPGDFFETELTLPGKIEEQTAIGALFAKLDSLIALHQRELDHVKELKKGLLQKMFPKEGTNAPELRFPGFTDPWEQRKLGELVEETYGGGTPKTSVPEYWGGDIPWIQSSNVIEGELFNIDIPKAITDKGLRESAAILIPGSSIAVVTHVGVGKLVYLPFSFTTSQDFVSLSRLKTNSIFVCYALFRRLQTEINMVQGSAIKGITKAELLDKRIDIPHDVEQTQIGAFFQKLDSLIALHQRELDHVKELKKGLLQQMFV